MKNVVLEAILRYAQEAGRVALDEQRYLSAELKSDDSYVTDVDLRLSELAIKTLSEVIPQENIITEEHLGNLHSLIRSGSLESAGLLVFVDPIDGTRNYFHGIPLYGISVGVFRDLEPWLGVVVFPALGEMFYHDGSASYMVSGLYSNEPVHHKLEPSSVALNGNAIVLLANSYVRQYRWSYDVCTPMVTACVAINACWPLAGRGIGTVLLDHVWDFAGSWPLLESVGFELRGLHSGKRTRRYDPSDFDEDTLMLKDPLVLSRPEHFERICEGVLPGAWGA